MTNTRQILAYVGVGEGNYRDGDDGISPTTLAAISEGKIIIKNNDEAHRTPEIHSMIVIPLWEKGEVTGTLKIYYRHAHRITWSLKEMAVGLSQIISTQQLLARVFVLLQQLPEMAGTGNKEQADKHQRCAIKHGEQHLKHRMHGRLGWRKTVAL